MNPVGAAFGGGGRLGGALVVFGLALLGAVVLPPPHAAFGDDDDEQEGESRTGRVAGPDDCRMGTSNPDYRAKLEDWGTPRKLGRHRWVRGFREVTFRNIHTRREAKLVLFDDDGEVTAEAREKISWIWTNSPAAGEKRIDDRLVKILYFTAVKFRADEIVVVSGYRDDRNESVTRPHYQGRAADVVVPGTSANRVRDYVRTYGKVGVGSYPVSGFVHLDVRARSFFWEDVSGPGQSSCYYQVDRDLARQVDEEYDAHHDDPRRLQGYHDWQNEQAARRRRRNEE